MTNKIFYAKITSVARICWRGSMAEQLICNQQVDGSTPFASSKSCDKMGEFPSGQRGQTVNLLSTTSLVRIQLPPPTKTTAIAVVFCFGGGSVFGSGFALLLNQIAELLSQSTGSFICRQAEVCLQEKAKANASQGENPA